ncbi:hypothetical protein EJ05DRAFT_304460 [Pseudovirgaria hyperparasitica]|uniref:U-box domain-containing protein n=1 Tax=Pseudovirgaria hyperparasitica TaxID=470096 RepID=A0A6A6W9T0_9PEZI|nr:uncharacterized protein EJ05DRAFT_304460 [Pseudovirgaria hyperparasitica]KAF2759628.1 hypothetical protein EJ05DRAFT_304460 [Pseudovirgaria hyperparasitica]
MDSRADQDKIRARRLARLGGGGGQPSSSPPAASNSEKSQSPNAPSPPPPTEVPNRAQPLTDNAQAPSEASNPFVQLGMKAENRPATKISITPQKRDGESENRPKARQLQPESLAAWEEKQLSGIFRVTLDDSRTTDIHGNALFFLPNLKEELESNSQEVRLTTSNNVLEQAVLEAGTGFSGDPLDYLLASWKRVSRQFRSMRSGERNERYNIYEEARRICMSYCIFAITIPEMFQREPRQLNPLAQHLLVDPENDRGICHDFLNEAVGRMNGEDGEDIKQALVGAMEQLSRELSGMSMNGNYKPYVLALRNFCRYQPLAVALSESPRFLPLNVAAQRIEHDTLLGPFFALSPMQGEVALNYFSGSAPQDRAMIANSQRALRLTLQTHQDEIFEITNAFVKTKGSRDRMLDWLALTVNANHKRRAIQVDRKTVSSDGFMVNVTVICDRLCEPFMDAQFGKIERIDVDYLRRSPRVDIREETKINADQNASDEFYTEKASGMNNFISEVFFLTVAAHHYGTEAAGSKLSTMQKDIKWLEKQVEKLELERHKFASNPQQLRLFENHVKKFKDELERSKATVHAIQGVLLDELTQSRSMQFMRYVIAWMLRLAVPGLDYPKQPLPLPMPEEQPMVFKCLPEYFLEDIVDNFKFITRNMPQIITQTQCKELVVFCIAFLRTTEYIKNPYVKSGLVTILYHGVHPVYGRSKGVLGDLLFADPFATEHLLHALMKFYIEAERTGTHTQFFDKFNIRYEIFQIIKCIWGNSIYHENLRTEAKVNHDFFVRFVNLLLNDVTFVLDESFTSFTQIHDLSEELRAKNSPLDEAARQEKEEALATAKGRAKSYMSLTNETVSMLKLFTEVLAESFTTPEIVQRLADMLDYNLDALTGPKSSNLRVENPQEYGWDAKTMLDEIVSVYMNLMDQPRFHTAVARDGRSYKPENFAKATTIMQRLALKSPEQIALWEALIATIRTAKELDDVAEEDFGDAPDDFLDPLLATLMEEPVLLPTSKQVVDMSTIRSQLLSDPTDPFNRAPLRIEDVVPDAALKARIEAWKAEKRQKRLDPVQGGGGGTTDDAMDTS